jgi:alpha,alpha-trehalase
MIDWTAYEAVLFDLDGVLTATARLHAASWKRMFDDYLQSRATARGEPFRPFEMPGDYARFVDGRPRYDGVRTFLASRDIALDDGAPGDPPGGETVCGLGNRKNAMFSDLLASEGVEAYDGSLAVVRHLLRHGVRCAVVSSSLSCEAILDVAGLADLFELRVDGQVAVRQGLAGKPAPDTFAYAARVLGVSPLRAVVVEDAIAGVEAGRAGGFGLVVAIDRTGETAALARAGADHVVTDLGDTLDNGDGNEAGPVEVR